MKNTSLRYNSYEVIRKIGRGNFGQVELVKSEVDSKHYIIKKLTVQQENKAHILKEIQLMRKLLHQFIIRYLESFVDEEKNVCIVMEYAECGDLENYLENRKKNNNLLTEDEILEWFTQLCFGLKYIHDHKVLHRDLKGQNIFITSNNQLKIGDFGISKIMHETFQMAKTKIGTPYVMAPEIWQNKKYNQKSDIWSLGCVLYKMITLRHAFQAKNTGSYVLKITSGKFNPILGNYSNELKEMVKQMLSLNPQDRPSVHSLLERPILKKNIKKYLNNTLQKYQQQQGLVHSSKLSRISSQQKLLSQKRSSSSLSSSMLTPKNQGQKNNNNNTMQNMKLIEMKQSYPILCEEIKCLKKELEEHQKRKGLFQQESNVLLERLQESSAPKEEVVDMVKQHLLNYFYS